MARKAAQYLSTKLQTVVQIGTFNFDFSHRIVLTDVYIQDLHNDTLLYSKKLKIGFEKLDLKNQHIKLSDVTLLNAKSKIIKYQEDEDYNIQFIIDASALLNNNGILYISFVEGDPTLSGFLAASTGDRTYFYFHELNVLTKGIMDAGFEAPQMLHVNYGDANSKQELHTILIAKKL